MGPLPDSNRHDEPGAIDQFVPVEAAMVDDVFVASEDPVGEPVVAHILPNALDRIELGRLGREGNERHVFGRLQLRRDVPTSPVHEHTTAWEPGSTASAISWRCNSIASVLQNGRTRPAALPSAGQMAPKM